MTTEQRVAKLERDNRRLRIALAVGVLVVAFVSADSERGVGKFKSVTAERFVLVDDKGNERGSMYTEKGAGRVLVLSSNSQAYLSTDKDQAQLMLRSNKETDDSYIIQLSASKTGGGINLVRKEQSVRISSPNDSDPYILIRHGEEEWTAP